MGAEKSDVLIVGGGPAGLRAAEIVSAAGRRTILAEHKASVGRKFLVAGRGGLNLTHSEAAEGFPARYQDVTGRWEKLLAGFSPDDLRAWAKELGIETFVGTSGRVFPTTKQAAPLLRRWIARLREQGVSFRARHELAGFQRSANGKWTVALTTPTGTKEIEARAVIFALGGASWPQTGSDGVWVKFFTDAGICVTPLQPANCGYEVEWPAEFLAEAEGLPLKNIVVRAGGESVAGELLVTKYGLEGGAIYQLGCVLRALKRPEIIVDLKPSLRVEELAAKLGPAKPAHLLDQAARAWRLGAVAIALLRLAGPFASAAKLATMARNYPIALRGPRPIDEAISTAGGVSWDELDDQLMIRSHPGLFCAGEMIDWDAPTGGYLLQGCFSTATCAAHGALALLQTCASD
jgi:uncharacterized flavoprotein (TIGR03862 family)